MRSPDRCFAAEPTQREFARALFAGVRDAPIVSPHGHVDPALLANADARFGSPADLLIIPDHYVTRMLYSQGLSLESLGVPSIDGTPVEQDHRLIWQRFADHIHLFRATPTGMWLADTLFEVFGIAEPLTSINAQRVYEQIAERLAEPAFRPRALFERFKIATLCTTDLATADLANHQKLRDQGWATRVRPTFRPDAVVTIDAPAWLTHIELLQERSARTIHDYASFILALETRRSAFKALGATATDHAAQTPFTTRLSNHEAETVFQRALHGTASVADAARFTGHMLLELARMSAEDGLVMQLHAGSYRNHDPALLARFGSDRGADIPLATEWTRNLQPLLSAYGSDQRFRLILFTLDESTYSRELAPLAGYYPAVLLGPPWWFFDSVNGIRRFLDAVVETAGFYNLAGFNDDTRAFCSIPVRHELWRRVLCNWLAGLVVEERLAIADAHIMAHDGAYRLAERAYNLASPVAHPRQPHGPGGA